MPTYSIMTTIKISPEQNRKLEALSNALHLTKGAVIRLAIERLFSEQESPTMSQHREAAVR